MNIVYQSGAATLRGLQGNEQSSLGVLETPYLTGATSNNTTIQDAIMTTYTGAGIINNCKLIGKSGTLDPILSYTALTPNIATIDQTGNVSFVSNGTAKFTANTAKDSIGFTRVMSNAVGTSTLQTDWVAGSLAKHIVTAITSMINGKTFDAVNRSTNLQYSGITNDAYRPNPNLFTGSLDLSAIPVSGPDMVLISPWHVIGSHMSSTGLQTWRDPNGNYFTRNVVAILPFSSNNNSDLNYVGILDAAITTITPMSIMPSSVISATVGQSKLAKVQSGSNKLQVLRRKQAGYTAIEVLDATLTFDAHTVSFNALGAPLSQCVTSPFSTWSSAIISGDSNGAVFVPVDVTGGTNYRPMLISSMNFTSGGRFYSNFFAEIQTLMNTLGASQTLPTISLTGFGSY